METSLYLGLGFAFIAVVAFFLTKKILNQNVKRPTSQVAQSNPNLFFQHLTGTAGLRSSKPQE